MVLALAACSSENPAIPAVSYRDAAAPFSSIASFQPDRFAGRWYEIASYPVPFQKGCTQTQANYIPADDGALQIINTCRRNGKLARIDGQAVPVGPGRLEVSFDRVPFVTAPYWVLWVDEDYQTAVIGVPSGRAGWILNRTPQLRADRLAAARQVLAFNGYDLSQLRKTPQ